ncbi:MAG TPA: MarR family transcriptional regulator [Nitriliruptorales bacterium]
MPIFRSRTQFGLLGELFLDPETAWTGADLAERIGASTAAVSRELDRLVTAGLVEERRRGNLRLVHANLASPAADDLRRLLLRSYGPAPVLRRLLSDVKAIERAQIFGSWARRAAGEPGPAPRDVDLLVVGDVEPLAVYEVARQATRELGLEVNPVVRTPAEWQRERTGFAHTVREGPTIDVTPPGNGA